VDGFGGVVADADADVVVDVVVGVDVRGAQRIGVGAARTSTAVLDHVNDSVSVNADDYDYDGGSVDATLGRLTPLE
jgi:hypothetical protein